jgi:hypothetical protein
MKKKVSAAKIRKHKTVVNGLRDLCGDDADLLFALVDQDDDDLRVKKLLRGAHGSHAQWSVGYLHGAAAELGVAAEDLL